MLDDPAAPHLHPSYMSPADRLLALVTYSVLSKVSAWTAGSSADLLIVLVVYEGRQPRSLPSTACA